MTLLRVEDLRLCYRVSRGMACAVDGVSLAVDRGGALGVVGESGAGKSSLALALMRLLPRNVALYAGKVELEGTDCTGLSDEEFRKEVRWKKMSMVFQRAMESLNPVIRVGHQVAEPLLMQPSVSKQDAYREAARLLQVVLLPGETFHRYPHELSGGMKQRVVIAMALVLKPQLIILDEPTSALDVSVQAQIMNLLKRLQREAGLSIIFVTHDIAVASELCHSMAVMYAGQFVEVGSAEEVLGSPAHPYTQKLLASISRLWVEGSPEFIPGVPPDPAALPQGCRFQPRCPYAFSRCNQAPPLLPVSRQQQARCWLAEKQP